MKRLIALALVTALVVLASLAYSDAKRHNLPLALCNNVDTVVTGTTRRPAPKPAECTP